MKLAILHQQLEWGERALAAYLNLKGHAVTLVEIHQTDQFYFDSVDCVLNRVYASVANRNWQDTALALDLISRLESAGIQCINSPTGCRADYDKFLTPNFVPAKERYLKLLVGALLAALPATSESEARY